MNKIRFLVEMDGTGDFQKFNDLARDRLRKVRGVTHIKTLVAVGDPVLVNK